MKMNGQSSKTCQITELGAEGDGIARSGSKSVYIPFALPGEEVTLKGKPKPIGKGNAVGELAAIVKASPFRREPSCVHFGQCGGCRLQHLETEKIAEHKRHVLITALGRKCLKPKEVPNTAAVPPHTRRRVRLDYQNTRRGSFFGFKKRRSHEGIDIKMCPVLSPELEKLLPELRRLLHRLPAMSGGGSVAVTETETGFDIIFIPTKGITPDLAQREHLADWCEEQSIARLCWDDGDGPQPIAARHPAVARFGDVAVELPINSFLQPSAAGELKLIRLVSASFKKHLVKPKKIADLFSGCGSFSLPLAREHDIIVDAFDIEDTMITALRQAVNHHEQTLRVTAAVRDLFNNPLTPPELKPYDAVIFDPPRAGAIAQAQEISLSRVPLIIAVSCNPSTLARDLRVLVDQGYTLETAIPVDQFTWSGQLEAVAILTR